METARTSRIRSPSLHRRPRQLIRCDSFLLAIRARNPRASIKRFGSVRGKDASDRLLPPITSTASTHVSWVPGSSPRLSPWAACRWSGCAFGAPSSQPNRPGDPGVSRRLDRFGGPLGVGMAGVVCPPRTERSSLWHLCRLPRSPRWYLTFVFSHRGGVGRLDRFHDALREEDAAFPA